MATGPDACTVQAHDWGDRSVISFAGPRVVLDEQNTQATGKRLLELVDQVGADWFVLDLRNVTYLTSTALELFLRLHRQLQARGRRFSLCHLGPRVHEIFRVTKLHEVFDIRQRAEELTEVPTG